MSKFSNGQHVVVPTCGLKGFVTGIAEYRKQEPDVQVTWVGPGGEKCTDWFGESVLAATQKAAAAAAKAATKPAAKARRQ